MSLLKCEKIQGNDYLMEVSVSKEDFLKEIEKVYKKNVSKINIAGFRKGKAPKSIIEKMYGNNVFWDDAINNLYPKAYMDAIKESGLEIVGTKKIDIISVDIDNGFKFKVECIASPEVEIGQYKNLNVTKNLKIATTEDVENEIQRIMNSYARTIEITDRPAKNGDIVIIDFEGKVDGVAFKGGQASNYSLTLGSNQFIPGFEDQIIGHKIGDEFDINVTFPDDYHQKSLASQKAIFRIILHSIKEVELPKLDDEFVKDISEFDDVESFKEDIKKSIQSYKDNQADLEVEHSLADMVISNMKADIPQIMIDNRVTELKSKFENNLKNQSLDIDTYLKYIGQSVEDFNKSFVSEAENNVKLSLALKKIIELEKIEASASEIDESIASLAKEYKITEDKVKQIFSNENIIENVKLDKAIKLIKDSAKITEVIAEQK